MSPLTRYAPTALVAAGTALYLAHDLVTHGLALDGLVYANIAIQLASSEGSFWDLPLFLSDTAFHDHPPLAIWLESLWFGVLGTSFWVEKFHGLAMLTLALYLTALLWRETTARHDAWLVMLALMIMPTSTYVFKNNYLESTVTVTVLLAVLCAWRSVHRGPWYAVGLGLLVAAGFLMKGPVACFPLLAPLIFQWSAGAWRKSFTRGVMLTAIAAMAASGVIAVLLIDPDARGYLATYFDQQIVNSLAGMRPAEHGRVYLLTKVATNLSIALGLMVLLAAAKLRPVGTAAVKTALGWLIVALSASIPLLVSPRQFQHYLLPSLPFYALAIASLVPRGDWRALLAGAWPVGSRTVWSVSGMLAAGAVVVAISNFDESGKDAAQIRAAQAIAAQVIASPDSSRQPIGFCDTAAEEFSTMAYLFRYHGLSSRPSRTNLDRVVCREPPSDSHHRRLALFADLALWSK